MAMRLPVILTLLLLTPSIAHVQAQEQDTGPTAALSYDDSYVAKNPIDVFMYFIPLTSPTRITLEKSPENTQTAYLTSFDLQKKGEKFSVRCEFTIEGEGFFINWFNHDDVIAVNSRDMESLRSMRNLDYMIFEGGGYGSIEIEGVYEGKKPVIKDMSINFDSRGAKSPLVFELYTVDPIDGGYDYEKRHSQMMARIGSLSFKPTVPGVPPTMTVKLSKLGNSESADGFFSSIKAKLANLFVSPIEINPHGNDALLDFATAIYQQKPEFVFPKARMLE